MVDNVKLTQQEYERVRIEAWEYWNDGILFWKLVIQSCNHAFGTLMGSLIAAKTL